MGLLIVLLDSILYCTVDLLASTYLYYNLPCPYLTALHPTMIVLKPTAFYHGSTGLYYTPPILFLDPPDFTTLHHDSTELYTLLDSTMALVCSTGLYCNLPCLYILSSSTLRSTGLYNILPWLC